MPAAAALFEQLEKSMRSEGPDLVKRIKVRRRRGRAARCRGARAAAAAALRPPRRARPRAAPVLGPPGPAPPPPPPPLPRRRPGSTSSRPPAHAPRRPPRAPRPRPAPTLQGLVVFDIDGEKWALDLRSGDGSLAKGAPSDKPDLTLTMTDANFAQLVMGKLNPQQVRAGGGGSNGGGAGAGGGRQPRSRGAGSCARRGE
jgi:hypothetical protein